MKVIFRTSNAFLENAVADLRRPDQRFRHERMAFISTRASSLSDGVLLLARGYHPVADEHYVENDYGATKVSQQAILAVLNLARRDAVGIFHVHLHEHEGTPSFSPPDLKLQTALIPSLYSVQRQQPHGAILFSETTAIGRVYFDPHRSAPITHIHSSGARNVVHRVVARRGLFA